MRKIALGLFVLACLANRSDAPPVVRFIQPKAAVILAGIYGNEIPVQLRIEPHADNRAYVIRWRDGSSAHTLDGADDSAIQPVSPLTVRVFAGQQTIEADVLGPGGKVRGHASFLLRVCGGDEDPCH